MVGLNDLVGLFYDPCTAVLGWKSQVWGHEMDLEMAGMCETKLRFQRALGSSILLENIPYLLAIV